ncbi:MAG: D-alanyl-D-alanine carboxypeptidase [Patescibacteria group bacterium]
MQNKFQKFVSVIFIVLGFGLLIFSFYQKPISIFQKLEEFAMLEMAAVPIRNSESEINNQEFLVSITAEAVYVMDNPSASTLLAKNEDERLFPASTVKMMTALTALKLYGDEDKFIVEHGDFEHGNKNNLVVGEELTRNDLLKLLLITSDNDAALLLAQHHDEGYMGFVREMNILAQELSLGATFFKNPIGFDDYEQLVSARDLAILAYELMQNEFLHNIVGIKETVVTDTSGKNRHNLYTTNEFLAEEFGIMGVKTGTTDLAGQVLVTQVEKGGKSILIVVMKSQDRFADTKKIIDFCFENYTWVNYQELID